jgi:arabinan endo-1,5-alpha-L-arabinosidase
MTRQPSYTNPVWPEYFADPFVVRWEDRYVAYGTGELVDGRAFRVLTSTDLVSWESVGGALQPLPADQGSDYWAPEVVAAEGRWWMYYSVGFEDRGHSLRVASAASPLGPFLDCGVDLTPDELFAIDPHPFRDVDGRWYLYYARDVLDAERVGTHLAVAELSGMTALSGPGQAVLAPTADWQIFERQRSLHGQVSDWHTLEGPVVLQRAGRYYLLYSGGSYLGEGYGVAWARADHPLGPWTEPDGVERLLATVPGHVRGPGHNSVVTTPAGNDVLVYHAWDEEMTQRCLCIDPLLWDDDGPRTPGPTWTEQPRPL